MLSDDELWNVYHRAAKTAVDEPGDHIAGLRAVAVVVRADERTVCARLARKRSAELMNANPTPMWADGTRMELDARIGAGFELVKFADALGVPEEAEHG